MKRFALLLLISSLARAQALPSIDADYMGGILAGTSGAQHDQLDKKYRELIRAYEAVLKKDGLTGSDVDPEPRNRKALRDFKKLTPEERLELVSEGRKEMPAFAKGYSALDNQSRLDDPKAVDALWAGSPHLSKVPLPTEDGAPVYFGDMIQRLGLVRRR